MLSAAHFSAWFEIDRAFKALTQVNELNDL